MLRSVAFDVPADLRPPEIRAYRRPSEEVAAVAVPETSVNENDGPKSWEDDVGPARQILPVQAISEAHPVKCRADCQLRLRVLPPNACHHPAANSRGDDIGWHHSAAIPGSGSASSPCIAIGIRPSRSSVSFRCGFINWATARTTGTTTAFPN